MYHALIVFQRRRIFENQIVERCYQKKLRESDLEK